MIKQSNSFYNFVKNSPFLMDVLLRANEFNLKNWWLVGGALRDVYWLDNSKLQINKSIIADIDIKYYDLDNQFNFSPPPLNGIKWSIKNQAFQVANDTEGPYSSVEESIFRAPETVNTFGVKLTEQGRILIYSGYGFDDLNDMIFRPTHAYLEKHTNYDYLKRVENKGWLKKWSRARTSISLMPEKQLFKKTA